MAEPKTKYDRQLRFKVDEESIHIDKQKVAAPSKSSVDKYQLVPEFLKVRGLVKQHLDSFNYFLTTDIKKILLANDRIEYKFDPSIFLRFKNIRIGKPTVTMGSKNEELSPHTCRLSDLTYSAPICVDIEYVHGSHDEKHLAERNGVRIGKMPIMLRSSHCVLYKKDEAELAKYGECPLDPGGYFIVKGTEKVILIQEQLSKNRIIIEKNPKHNIQASVVSSTAATKSKTVIYMDRKKAMLYLSLNRFTKEIPIMAVMKALGMESDQEVVQMLGRDPRYGALLLPSMQECSSLGIHTRRKALEYLDSKVKQYRDMGSEKECKAFPVLRDILVANVPVHMNNLRPKCIYIAVMLRRIMEAILNNDATDDKDYVGNKRLELSGQMISILFEDLFKSMIDKAKGEMQKLLDRHGRSSKFDLSSLINKDSIISMGLERALSTGNWDAQRFGMHKKGVSQVLARLSYIGTLGFMTKISPQFEKTRKVSGPRALQPSQVLDDDGVAAPGEIIRAGDVYINKESLKPGSNEYDRSYEIMKRADGEDPHVVDRVALFSDNDNNLCLKFMIRQTRRPEVGDKFSSRHGQKGVCGTIVQQEDFVFSERGICPDLIMNPHGFPSRMTVGKMIELLGGKAGVSLWQCVWGA